MPTRAQRMLRGALHRTGLSHEAFADAHPKAVAYKSGRTLRRYDKGDAPIPDYVVDSLRHWHDTRTPPTE